VGTTDFRLLGAASNTSGVTFTAAYIRTVVGAFVKGNSYSIVSLGTTTNDQWNIIAGTSEAEEPVTYSVGSEFTCVNVGTDANGTSFGNGTAQDLNTGIGTGTVLEYTSIPLNYYQSDDIEVFVAGRRLIKAPVALFNEDTPTLDVTVEAEFSVTGLTPYVRLTVAPAPGARITVIQRRGNVWHTVGNNIPTSLTHDNTAVAKFIQEHSSLLPSFITPPGNVLNTESGNTVDDENNDPIEY
jgi:hypothetical protein